MSAQRLQKFIAQAGIASRRKAEALIKAGRVRVNGKITTEMGVQVDPRADKVEVDGRRVHAPKVWSYILLNKPAGVVTTASDELDRKTVLDLVKVPDRVFPVGRLDLDAEGVLLLTNDGALTQLLTHPRNQISKVYHVRVRGIPEPASLQRLLDGVILEDGLAQAQAARLIRGPRDRDEEAQKNAWVEIMVAEGRNHLVKRMLDAVGHRVVRLRRVEFAGLTVDGIAPGKWRNLRKEELRKLKARARGKGRGEEA
ncbi:rRNA pseudouridine synthase [Myxococcota bacterium]|nr:rRNA pseudouridine synthase [Myxococcota bacterium]MBU1430342.1 rRNA pseudouridine synthase [Myxococcota bacterium]MBU1896385.1 rRNA pseudouridine synthase [Myxococcota bacterium]